MKKFALCLVLAVGNMAAMHKNSPPMNYSQLSNAVKKAVPYIFYTAGLAALAGTTYYIGSQLRNSDECNCNGVHIELTCDDSIMLRECLNATHNITKWILNCETGKSLIKMFSSFEEFGEYEVYYE